MCDTWANWKWGNKSPTAYKWPMLYSRTTLTPGSTNNQVGIKTTNVPEETHKQSHSDEQMNCD